MDPVQPSRPIQSFDFETINEIAVAIEETAKNKEFYLAESKAEALLSKTTQLFRGLYQRDRYDVSSLPPTLTRMLTALKAIAPSDVPEIRSTLSRVNRVFFEFILISTFQTGSQFELSKEIIFEIERVVKDILSNIPETSVEEKFNLRCIQVGLDQINKDKRVDSELSWIVNSTIQMQAIIDGKEKDTRNPKGWFPSYIWLRRILAQGPFTRKYKCLHKMLQGRSYRNTDEENYIGFIYIDILKSLFENPSNSFSWDIRNQTALSAGKSGTENLQMFLNSFEDLNWVDKLRLTEFLVKCVVRQDIKNSDKSILYSKLNEWLTTEKDPRILLPILKAMVSLRETNQGIIHPWFMTMRRELLGGKLSIRISKLQHESQEIEEAIRYNNAQLARFELENPHQKQNDNSGFSWMKEEFSRGDSRLTARKDCIHAVLSLIEEENLISFISGDSESQAMFGSSPRMVSPVEEQIVRRKEFTVSFSSDVSEQSSGHPRSQKIPVDSTSPSSDSATMGNDRKIPRVVLIGKEGSGKSKFVNFSDPTTGSRRGQMEELVFDAFGRVLDMHPGSGEQSSADSGNASVPLDLEGRVEEGDASTSANRFSFTVPEVVSYYDGKGYLHTGLVIYKDSAEGSMSTQRVNSRGFRVSFAINSQANPTYSKQMQKKYLEALHVSKSEPHTNINYYEGYDPVEFYQKYPFNMASREGVVAFRLTDGFRETYWSSSSIQYNWLFQSNSKSENFWKKLDKKTKFRFLRGMHVLFRSECSYYPESLHSKGGLTEYVEEAFYKLGIKLSSPEKKDLVERISVEKEVSNEEINAYTQSSSAWLFVGDTLGKERELWTLGEFLDSCLPSMNSVKFNNKLVAHGIDAYSSYGATEEECGISLSALNWDLRLAQSGAEIYSTSELAKHTAHRFNNIAFNLYRLGRYEEALKSLHEADNQLKKVKSVMNRTQYNLDVMRGLSSIFSYKSTRRSLNRKIDIHSLPMGKTHLWYAHNLIITRRAYKSGSSRDLGEMVSRIIATSDVFTSGIANKRLQKLDVHDASKLGAFAAEKICDLVANGMSLHNAILSYAQDNLSFTCPRLSDRIKSHALYNLGVTLFEDGMYDEAILWLERVREAKEAMLGEEHPDVARCLSLIGAAKEKQGNYLEAIKCFEQALKIREESDVAYVAESLNNLGVLLAKVGRDQEALECLKKAYSIRSDDLEKTHPLVLSSAYHYGVILGKVGQTQEAHKILKEVQDLSEKQFGEKSLKVAQTISGIGDLLEVEGKLVESLQTKLKALEMFRVLFGEEHHLVSHALASVGMTQIRVGHFREANSSLRGALDRAKKLDGSEHPNTALIMSSLGRLLCHQGAIDEAFELQERSLVVFRKSFGEEHSRVVQATTSLGITLEKLGKQSEALQLYRKVLRLSTSLFGKDSIQVTHAHVSLGRTLGNLGKHREALGHEKKALDQFISHYGKEHVLVAQSLSNIGSTYEDLGDDKAAEETTAEACDLSVKLLGNGHDLTQFIGKRLQQLRMKKKSAI